MTTARRRGLAAEVGGGAATAMAGLRAWVTDPRTMLLGAVPGLVTAAALTAGVVALALHADDVGGWLGDRAAGAGWLGDAIGIAAALALLAGGVVIAVAVFTTLTLAIGQPFFEAISRRVDARAGGLPTVAPDEPWLRALGRGLAEGALTVAISVLLSVGMLLVGLVPVVGTATAFTAGALIGGRLLAIELTAYPMARRGIVSRRDRIRALRPLRARTVTFGALVFLAFLVPGGAVATMPAAVAGATVLVRHASRAPERASDGQP